MLEQVLKCCRSLFDICLSFFFWFVWHYIVHVRYLTHHSWTIHLYAFSMSLFSVNFNFISNLFMLGFFVLVKCKDNLIERQVIVYVPLCHLSFVLFFILFTRVHFGCPNGNSLTPERLCLNWVWTESSNCVKYLSFEGSSYELTLNLSCF